MVTKGIRMQYVEGYVPFHEHIKLDGDNPAHGEKFLRRLKRPHLLRDSLKEKHARSNMDEQVQRRSQASYPGHGMVWPGHC